MIERLTEELESYIVNAAENKIPGIFDNPTSSLEVFARVLPVDRPIAELERLESLYKKLLKHIAQLNNPELVYLVAKTQKEIGFILKYKPYGIKASTPLGFSIFFLENGEGFSFQRHLDTKTEVFYFIEVRPGKSFAFLCSYPEWEANYRPALFSEWLVKGDMSIFDRFCHNPESGDILKINKIGLVHTVLGCVMEEYANVSTDMVDRLYDQNKDNSIPKKFTREYFQSQLNNIQYPQRNRLVSRNEIGFISQSLEWMLINKIKMLSVAETDTYVAKRVLIPPKESWQFTSNKRFMSAFIGDGSARCELLKQNGLMVTGRKLFLDKHDVFLSLPRCNWRISNSSEKELQLSVFEIDEHSSLQ